MNPALEVLYEDNHLLVLNKPALLPTMGTPDDRATLLSLAKQYIKERHHKPGNVYLGIVSRLDAPVTGVVLLARTSKAAARLTEQFRLRAVEKIYWAVVEGAMRQPSGELIDWLGKDERHRRMHVVAAEAPAAQQARLTYRQLQATARDSLLEVTLDTGRKHQIRLQLSHHGHPVLGDWKYGSRRDFKPGIALHARRLALAHPVGGAPLAFVAPLPKAWRRLGLGD
jgi:23S rRNA pseudouridine1911/1915/1917 synthase